MKVKYKEISISVYDDINDNNRIFGLLRIVVGENIYYEIVFGQLSSHSSTTTKFLGDIYGIRRGDYCKENLYDDFKIKIHKPLVFCFDIKNIETNEIVIKKMRER